MATFPFAANPYYQISHIMAALNIPNDALRVVDGTLYIEGVDQADFDRAIQGLDPLAGLRDSVNSRLKQACANAIVGGIDYRRDFVPTDERTQLNLTGLCLAALSGKVHGKPFASKFWVKNQKWIRKEFTGDEFIEMGEAVIAHVQSQQSHYEDLLEQVETAVSAAQLLSIAW